MRVFFFLLGVVSIFAQAVLLREITTLFYGNEFFYGLGLGVWLLLTGLGSLLAIRLRQQTKTVFILLITLFLVLPCLLIGLRWLVVKTIPLGTLPEWPLTLATLSLTLAIFCLPLGALFPLGVLAWQGKKTTNQAFFWETLGFAFGGLGFSFVLATTSFPLTNTLNRLSLSWHYPQLSKAFNSRFHQVIVSQDQGQESFFLNGQVAFTTQEEFATDKLLSLITPFVSQPKTILVLGSPNLARLSATKTGIETVEFLEVDNKLLALEKKALGPTVKPITIDPRRFLAQTKKQWDLVIFSPGNPETLLTNRYFTREAFDQLKNRLTNKGLLAVLFYLPTDYQSPEALYFVTSIYQALDQVFPSLKLFAFEDQLLLLASQEGIRLQEAQIEPLWQDQFWFQLQDPKNKEVLTKIQSTPAKTNTDFEPAAFFYQNLFKQTMFSFRLPRVIRWVAFLIPFLLAGLVLLVFLKAKKSLRFGFLAASSSFILLTLEVLIIFFFQTKIGYLYSQLSLIFASVLLGMAVGVKLAQAVRASGAIRAGFLAYLAILALFFFGLKTVFAGWSVFWFGLCFLTGLVGGLIFASVNLLYLGKQDHPGFIYGFDLFGGCLGAFLTSSLLLPVFGVRWLLIGLAGLCLVNAKHPVQD